MGLVRDHWWLMGLVRDNWWLMRLEKKETKIKVWCKGLIQIKTRWVGVSLTIRVILRVVLRVVLSVTKSGTKCY